MTIIIPCFNEETWIRRTILSCMNQYYPSDKLEVIVVDDCSSDRSVEVIKETIEEIKSSVGERLRVNNRLSYIVQEKNAGKRAALCRGVDGGKGGTGLFSLIPTVSWIHMRLLTWFSRSRIRRWVV